ncbi:MAG: lipid-transfer protein [Acidimicrobiaceae bacterium]|nr:lipid-transfer protein [Acidimicrobiaceae bacterium]|tara:strand:- start:18816 stop:20012 length:1197 start_codon:yes stop_codon:yes gene_type:complete
MSVAEIAVLGVGMHKWGKFPGKTFVDIGVEAANSALDDSGIGWDEIQFLSGANTVRNGYPGWVSASTFANALGFQGCQIASSYAACASGATALSIARSQILSGICDVALVIGADQVEKGMFAPVPGERPNDVDWLRFRLMGLSNPAYFGMFARRRMALYGDRQDDFAAVKVKNSQHGVNNPNARYAKEFTIDDVNASPVVADPLRLLEICSTSDGGAALVVSSLEYARKKGFKDLVKIAGISTVSPVYPNAIIDMPYFASDSWVSSGDKDHTFKNQIAQHAYKEAGIKPSDLDFAEVYDLSSAYELDWYEHIGLCEKGKARELLHNGDTRIGGKVPVNPSGGLGAFGEAIPAQAIAQVCELTWQLRGEATGRQVENAKVGMSINYGMFGHGSSVIARI